MKSKSALYLILIFAAIIWGGQGCQNPQNSGNGGGYGGLAPSLIEDYDSTERMPATGTPYDRNYLHFAETVQCGSPPSQFGAVGALIDGRLRHYDPNLGTDWTVQSSLCGSETLVSNSLVDVSDYDRDVAVYQNRIHILFVSPPQTPSDIKRAEAHCRAQSMDTRGVGIEIGTNTTVYSQNGSLWAVVSRGSDTGSKFVRTVSTPIEVSLNQSAGSVYESDNYSLQLTRTDATHAQGRLRMLWQGTNEDLSLSCWVE